MWTERERIITNFDEAIEYIESKECFHDYRLGNIDISEKCIQIMIEEDTRNEHNENAHIWDFSFRQTSNLKVVMDCVLTPYIDEVSIENQEMVFSLTNGCIIFQAEDISLGIPQVKFQCREGERRMESLGANEEQLLSLFRKLNEKIKGPSLNL